MAIITKPIDIDKNVPAQFTLDKVELLALSIVSQDSYYSDMLNWNRVVLYYLSSSGNQKAIVNFDATESSPSSNFLVSEKSLDEFQIQRIVIQDFDGGYLVVPRSALNVSEFDVDLAAQTPVLLYEINPISTVAGLDLLTGTGRGFVSISQPIYVTRIELKLRQGGFPPNTGENVQDLRVRIVSQDGVAVLGTSDLPGLDLVSSDVDQYDPGLATWQVFNFSTPVLISDAKLAIQFQYTSVDRILYFVSSAAINEANTYDPGIRVIGYNA